MTTNNIISKTQLDQIVGKNGPVVGKDGKEYHSASERRYVEEITSIPLPDIQKELNDRIVVQHVDFKTSKPTFNAFSKKVIIADENGKRILIDNHDEIGKMQRKLAKGSTPQSDATQRLEMNGIEVSGAETFEEEFEFD